MSKELLDTSVQLVELTGRMGCGKSLAAAALREVKIHVVNADTVAHCVITPGSPAYNDIVDRWPQAETEAGIDRNLLRELVFGTEDLDAIKELEDIMHPRIKAETIDRLNEGSGPYVVYERPALKKPSTIEPDYILFIDQPDRHKERGRIMTRGCNNGRELTGIQVTGMLSRQLLRDELLDMSDAWIRNIGTRRELREKIFAWDGRYTNRLVTGIKKPAR